MYGGAKMLYNMHKTYNKHLYNVPIDKHLKVCYNKNIIKEGVIAMTNTKNTILTIMLSIVLIGILTLWGLIVCAQLTNNPATEDTTYVLRAKVLHVEEAEINVVECKDTHGEVWSFYTDEDYLTGSFILLLMDDCNTKSIYDDKAVDARLDPFAY